MSTQIDTVSKIVAFESGQLDQEEIVAFFQEMVDSGIVWQLRGEYGALAEKLIDQGMVRVTYH